MRKNILRKPSAKTSELSCSLICHHHELHSCTCKALLLSILIIWLVLTSTRACFPACLSRCEACIATSTSERVTSVRLITSSIIIHQADHYSYSISSHITKAQRSKTMASKPSKRYAIAHYFLLLI